jgi:hypothetical protein
MIDIDKIEAAANAANRDDNTMDDLWEHWRQNGPATVLEMVSMIRERDAVLPPPFRKQGQQMTYDGYDKAPCDLYAKEQMQEAVDQITQIQEQNTYLDKVASNLQDLCDKQAKMLADRDAVLRQALEAFKDQTDLDIISEKAVAAIKGVLAQ